MSIPLILASGSAIRAALLRQARVPFTVERPRLDEESIKRSFQAEGAAPREIADALAEAKAMRVSSRAPGAFVLGCDQVLDFDGRILSKPETREEARDQLSAMRGKRHNLLSAAVIAQDGQPIWRHVGLVRLTMRDLSDAYLDDYLSRAWPGIGDSVGGYKLEEEGVRLFSAIDGDYHAVLGLPLIPLLTFLVTRGVIEA